MSMMTLSQMRTREKEIENWLNFLWDAKEIEPSIRFGEFNSLLREKEKLTSRLMLAEANPKMARTLGLLI